MSDGVDVAVVGGGVVGLAVAWRARARGLTVRVLDRGELGGGTSRVAAGMLAPVAEADPGERPLLALGLQSARRWPAFAAELEDVTGLEVGYRSCGTLLVARDRDEAEALERELELRGRLGVRAQRVLPSAARRLEPALAPALRLALDLPGDHAVDPRALLAALAEACRRAGVQLQPHTDVPDPRALDAGRVVLAAGPWSGPPVRPVKGQALALRDPSGPGLVDRVLRWDGGYLVPRGDGRYYLGATMEEQGFDTAVTALGVYELLRDAGELVPGVLELELTETLCGLRPGTPDNAPLIGPDPDDPRLVWATGHFRGGVLLAPATADLVTAELCGEAPEHAFAPGRFAAEVRA
ncbi:glycine oxidase ThiO [Conexibacter sp. SYSU D00693]|uniref:glycine oxidase ThiO n=1 Tax=Conexibacter sp. SYSU D00693 TaxID=2812560 RepID=UPI00196A2DCE|nr:glycine oxidase ThiO [Conexibacter sp. SYSU D00693]